MDRICVQNAMWRLSTVRRAVLNTQLHVLIAGEHSLYRHFKRQHPDINYEAAMEESQTEGTDAPQTTSIITLPSAFFTHTHKTSKLSLISHSDTNSASSARIGDTLVIDNAEFVVIKVAAGGEQTSLHLLPRGSGHYIVC